MICMDNIMIEKLSENLIYSTAVRSDIGGREQQQDRAYLCIHEDQIYAVVCDGMGGAMDGRAASDAALATMRHIYMDYYSEGAVDASSFLYHAMIAADKAVSARMTRGIGGTTLVAAILTGEQMHWVSVGDSRLYIIRSGKILQATRDHNYQLRLNEMLQQEEITSELYHKEMVRGDALLSYLGKGNLTLYDLTQAPFTLQSGDAILLTTDGLFRTLSDEDVCTTITANIPTSQKADILMRNILNKDNHSSQDNTTFILIDVL